MAVALAHTVLKMRSLAASASGSMASTPTAGNLMVVVVNTYGGTVANCQVTDNQTGNTYTHITSADATRVATGQASSVHYAKNINSTGTFTITADGKTGCTAVTAFAIEVSGADTTAPFTSGEDGGGNGNLSPMAGASHATATADCFVAGTGGINAADASNTFTPNNSWTVAANELDGSAWYACNSSYKVLAATGTQQYSCAFTEGSGTADYAASWAAFIGATGGGGGGTAASMLMLLGVG